jgi:hypothetical protein
MEEVGGVTSAIPDLLTWALTLLAIGCTGADNGGGMEGDTCPAEGPVVRIDEVIGGM